MNESKVITGEAQLTFSGFKMITGRYILKQTEDKSAPAQIARENVRSAT